MDKLHFDGVEIKWDVEGDAVLTPKTEVERWSEVQRDALEVIKSFSNEPDTHWLANKEKAQEFLKKWGVG